MDFNLPNLSPLEWNGNSLEWSLLSKYYYHLAPTLQSTVKRSSHRNTISVSLTGCWRVVLAPAVLCSWWHCSQLAIHHGSYMTASSGEHTLCQCSALLQKPQSVLLLSLQLSRSPNQNLMSLPALQEVVHTVKKSQQKLMLCN